MWGRCSVRNVTAWHFIEEGVEDHTAHGAGGGGGASGNKDKNVNGSITSGTDEKDGKDKILLENRDDVVDVGRQHLLHRPNKRSNPFAKSSRHHSNLVAFPLEFAEYASKLTHFQKKEDASRSAMYGVVGHRQATEQELGYIRRVELATHYKRK